MCRLGYQFTNASGTANVIALTSSEGKMVSGYDEFSDRAFPDYPGGTSRQRWHRDLLRRAMAEEGFKVYEEEWWHFDYKDWRKYPILNVPLDK